LVGNVFEGVAEHAEFVDSLRRVGGYDGEVVATSDEESCGKEDEYKSNEFWVWTYFKTGPFARYANSLRTRTNRGIIVKCINVKKYVRLIPCSLKSSSIPPTKLQIFSITKVKHANI